MPTTRLYLIRHGSTEINRLRPYRLQGRNLDPPLDALGVEQARRAAGALAGVPLDALYASPLLRARETARIVGAPRGLEPVPVPELIEADLGRWEGRSWPEIEASEPGEYRRYMANPGLVPYPDGESYQDAYRRAAPALAALAAAHPGGRVAVIGHNIIHRAVLAILLGLPIDRARALRQSNCGINVIDFAGDGPRVLTLNAALHLEGLDPEAFPPEPPG